LLQTLNELDVVFSYIVGIFFTNKRQSRNVGTWVGAVLQSLKSSSVSNICPSGGFKKHPIGKFSRVNSWSLILPP
jgi:hypothetical protein